jgi:hypothetical protein
LWVVFSALQVVTTRSLVFTTNILAAFYALLSTTLSRLVSHFSSSRLAHSTYTLDGLTTLQSCAIEQSKCSIVSFARANSSRPSFTRLPSILGPMTSATFASSETTTALLLGSRSFTGQAARPTHKATVYARKSLAAGSTSSHTSPSSWQIYTRSARCCQIRTPFGRLCSCTTSYSYSSEVCHLRLRCPIVAKYLQIWSIIRKQISRRLCTIFRPTYNTSYSTVT